MGWSGVDRKPERVPQLELLLDEAMARTGQIHELWSYALLMLMFYSEQAHIVRMRATENGTEVEFETTSRRRCRVVRPQMNGEQEQELLNAILQGLTME